MAKPWLAFLVALPVMAQIPIPSRPVDHGWGMAVGTGFSAVPLVIDLHYTFSSGVGFYLGGGGTPHPRDSEFSFSLNFNDRGTLRKQESAGHLGIAVTRHPRMAWGWASGSTPRVGRSTMAAGSPRRRWRGWTPPRRARGPMAGLRSIPDGQWVFSSRLAQVGEESPWRCGSGRRSSRAPAAVVAFGG